MSQIQAELVLDTSPPENTAVDLANLKKIVDRAAALQNTIAGATAIVATVCISVKQATCSALASAVSGVTWLGSAVTTQASLDLNDENFVKIASPDGRKIDLSKLPPSTQALVTTLIRANDLVTVIDLTAKRAMAAAKAGNGEWVRKQLDALFAYNEQLSQASKQMISELASYATITPSQSGKISNVLAAAQSESLALSYQLQASSEDLKGKAFLSCLFQNDDGITGYLHSAFCRGVEAVLK